MPALTRRTLLKASAIAGAYGAGLAFAGRFGRAEAAPKPMILRANRIQAALTDVAPTEGVLTWGDGGMPPVLRMKKGGAFLRPPGQRHQ